MRHPVGMELEFTGEVWQWRGPAPYYFVTVPEDESWRCMTSPTSATAGA